jgi:hypothetical protein
MKKKQYSVSQKKTNANFYRLYEYKKNVLQVASHQTREKKK